MGKNNNTLKIVVAAALIAISELCGCTSVSNSVPVKSQAEKSADKSESSKSLQTAADPERADIDRNLIQPVIKVNDESLYDTNNKKYRLKCVYETISLDEESAKKYPELERALKAYSEELLAEQRKIIDQAKDDPDLKEGFDLYYDNSFYLDVTRADSEILSCRTTLCQYTGGIHPNTFEEGVSFDSKTGKRIQLSDVVTSKENLIPVVRKYLKENNPNTVFWDLDKSMNSYLMDPEYDLKWYYTPEGVCLSFDPYILASFNQGRFTVFLPFADYPDLFKGDFKASSGAFIYPISSDKEIKVDLDRDGKLESVGARPNSYDNRNQTYTSIEIIYEGMTNCIGSLSFKSSESIVVHTLDNKNYVYVFTGNSEGYTETHVFELKDSHAEYRGSIDAAMTMPYSNYLYGNEKKRVTSVQRLRYPLVNPERFVLQRRSGNSGNDYDEMLDYRVGEDGMPEVRRS